MNKTKCAYKQIDGSCTHPGNRSCGDACMPTDETIASATIADIEQFVEDNPEFSISDFDDIVILNPEAGDAIRQLIDGRDMLAALDVDVDYTQYPEWDGLDPSERRVDRLGPAGQESVLQNIVAGGIVLTDNRNKEVADEQD